MTTYYEKLQAAYQLEQIRADLMGRAALEYAVEVCKREALRYEVLSFRATSDTHKAEYLRCRAVCRDLAADLEGRVRDAILIQIDVPDEVGP